MENMMTNGIGVVILLREFCNKCPDAGNCHDKNQCNVVQFAQFIVDKGFSKNI